MAEIVAGKAAEEVVVRLFTTIERQFRYLFHYHDNLEKLDSRFRDLEGKTDRVKNAVGVAKRNLEDIQADVKNWLSDVEVKKKEVEGLLEDMRNNVGNGCWRGWCLNFKPRYSLSKKAFKKIGEVKSLLAKGDFTTVSCGQRPLGVVDESIGGSDTASNANASSTFERGFESRTSIMKDIMKALKDESIRVIRVCGMGGVGKTTMAKEVEKRVREEHLFQEIAKAEFNQHPDVRLVQRHLAESVGFFELKEDDISARANRLCSRLNSLHHEDEKKKSLHGDEKKKILLILDNVWKTEDLERVGIPLDTEKMNCKILLTSRSEDVCAYLPDHIQKIFRVGVLSDHEAQTLFKTSVGSADRYADMHQLAENIVKECGGLPLAIKIIGRTLAEKNKDTWQDVLGQLKASALQGEYADVYKSLGVSYSYLELQEIKDFFLLCSLYPEGFDVPIEDLVRCGVGLKLFKRLENVHEARIRAHAHVEKLVKSNLLLVSSIEGCVKMHDLVRDFALSNIASNGQYLVNHGHGTYTFELPDNGLNCPKLKLLKLVSNDQLRKLPNDFYECIGALSVVAFSGTFIPVSPSSVQPLKYLRTLFINNISRPCDISTIVNMEKLQVLSLVDSVIKQFPCENGKFCRGLKLLDLTKTKIVDSFPANVLSYCIHLEELYVRGSVGFYSNAEEEKTRIDEIKSLTKLAILDINIRYVILPFDFQFENLKRFKISIWSNRIECYSDKLAINSEYRFKNTLKLIVDNNILEQDGYKELLRKAEILDLEVKGVETFLHESEKEGFPNLELLSLESCNEMVYLVNTRKLAHKNVFPNLKSLYLCDMSSLKSIYHIDHSAESFGGINEEEIQESLHSQVGPARHPMFGNLRVLEVNRCNKLEYMFSMSITIGLVKLERLYIDNCQMMRAIFSREREDEDEKAVAGRIEFPNLKYLKLGYLPELTSLFADGNDLASNDHQVNASARDPFFNQKGQHTVGGFPSLRSIVIDFCDSLQQLFTPSIAVLFGKLQILEVQYCVALQAIVATEGEDEECEVKKILFPQLSQLTLSNLKNLTTLMPKIYTFNWSSLETLKLVKCGGQLLLSNISGLRNDTSGQEIALASLDISDVNMLSSIPFPARRTFPLKKLNLSYSDKPTISHLIQGFDLLEDLNLRDCDCLKSAFDLGEFSVVEGEHKVVIPFPQLRTLDISFLKSMTDVWKIGSHDFQGFQNLTNLTLSRCNSLRYSLSPFIAKHLVKLQFIHISYCKTMEEVLSDRDDEVQDPNVNAAAGDIVLPQLRTMWLSELPNLVSIGPGALDFDGPSFEGPSVNETSRHREVIGSSRSISSPISNEASSSSAALGGIAHRRYPASSFCYPKDLDVENCDKMLHVISSYSGNVKGLQKLDELSVACCESVLGIFEVDGINNNIDEERALTISNLTQLHLLILPKLVHICNPRWVMEFPKLQRVIISDCEILRYIFCSATVTSLVHLQYLKISECKMMEVIVQESEEEEASAAKGESSRTTKLVLPRLEEIILRKLPNLKGICLGLRDFDLPSLISIEIEDCPEMKIFTTGYSSTPDLETISIDSTKCSLEGDLNTLLKHLQDEKAKREDQDENADEDKNECTSSTSN